MMKPSQNRQSRKSRFQWRLQWMASLLVVICCALISGCGDTVQGDVFATQPVAGDDPNDPNDPSDPNNPIDPNPNQRPVVFDLPQFEDGSEAYPIEQGGSLQVTLRGSDPDGDPLVIAPSNVPADVFLIDGASDTPTIDVPSDMPIGRYSFEYAASDGQLISEPATVTFEVFVANPPPEANDINILDAQEDVPVAITLDGTDSFMDPLTYSIQSLPASAKLFYIDAFSEQIEITSVPFFFTEYVGDLFSNENENGEDSFTYLVNDGTQNSQIATVTLLVAPVDDPPTIEIPNLPVSSITENTLDLTILVTDPDLGSSVGSQVEVIWALQDGPNGITDLLIRPRTLSRQFTDPETINLQFPANGRYDFTVTVDDFDSVGTVNFTIDVDVEDSFTVSGEVTTQVSGDPVSSTRAFLRWSPLEDDEIATLLTKSSDGSYEFIDLIGQPADFTVWFPFAGVEE